MMIKNSILSGVAFAALLVSGYTVAAQDFSDVTVRSEHVAGNIHVLFGAGGNIGVSIGEGGTFLIDDQFAPLTDKIKAAVAELSDKPIRYVINTHFHGDHTGGNENLAKDGSIIIAHDNVRQRMAKGSFIKAFNSRTEPKEGPALPVITFDSKVSLHINGEEARAIHIPHAHTDSDSLIHFKKSNVIHMGDTFFNDRYPFIDVDGGGHIDGVIASVEAALSLADDETRVIPGHGPVAGKNDLMEYGRIVRTARDKIKAEIDKGTSLEELQASTILEGVGPYPATNDWAKRFIGFVYDSFAK